MGIFDSLGKQGASRASQQQPQQVDPHQMQQAFQNDLASLKADPIAYAKAHGKNIPDGMTDPNQMLQYMLRNTNTNNPRYQMVMRLLGMGGR